MSEETLFTIPDTTAHHVLSQSRVTLGAGPLSVVSSLHGTHLILTVGSAGFTLRHGMVVGTLEGNPRAYVFTPEIEGDENGGFVQITLPEGVTQDGSSFSALQTKFEEILITYGLLQPSTDAADRSKTWGG